MAGKAFLRDDSGSVTIDWVVLSAGILILGLIVVIQVMGNSSGYLMDEFESLNQEYEADALALSELRSDPARASRAEADGEAGPASPR